MHRLLEMLFGLEHGFLSREGEFHWHFHPQWPLQDQVGAVSWNFLLIALGALLVWYVYKHEGRSRTARIVLGVIRGALLAIVLMILNRPVLSLEQSIKEL